METKTVKVNMKGGAEARPIALLVQEASRFDSRIYLEMGTKKVNAKSIMGMMSLGLTGGDEITVECEGADEVAALGGVTEFLEGKN